MTRQQPALISYTFGMKLSTANIDFYIFFTKNPQKHSYIGFSNF
ncbi:hypothetical protein BRYFOR_05563 [Marvinbryantia formatexigens DSM 14469]|uniref:Uncharacterized protein n=1 Tax=Marvinbryantia formatexigens DSM 14469 TaxID=478749 RepID=C6LAC1_9FIRM|nr:hypothetical protein BRYFOR_05563 [Marvinbryantia formatexigens DSM 14469]